MSRLTDPAGVRLYIAALLLFILVAVGAWSPQIRMWGFNHLAYYPVSVRIGALSLVALAFVPAIGGSLVSGVQTALSWVRARYGRTVVASAVLAILALVVFTKYKSATLLLGDGQLVANEFATLSETEPTVTGGVARIVAWERIAPLTSVVHYIVVYVGASAFGAGPAQAIASFYCLLGALAVFIVSRVVLSPAMPDDLVAWLALILPACGALQLFFGYVENYGLLFLMSGLFTVASYRCLHGMGAVWVPPLLWVLAAASHIMAVLLLPALIYLIWVTRWPQRRPAVAFRVVFIATIVVFAAARFLPALGRFYRPYLTAGDTNGVLSLAHAADVLNVALLLMPAFLVVMPVLRRFRRGEAGEIQIEEWHLGISLLLPAAIFALRFRAEIGMSRDWDLFVMTALGMIPILILLLMRAGSVERLRHSVAPVIVGGIVLSAAWVGVNASTERSLQRYQDTLKYDRTNAAYAYETLARVLRDLDRSEAAAAALESSLEAEWNPRLATNLASMYLVMRDEARAESLYVAVLERSPNYSLARELIVALYENQQEWQALEAVARAGTELFPDNPFFFHYQGRALQAMGREEEARAVQQKAQLLQLQRRRP